MTNSTCGKKTRTLELDNLGSHPGAVTDLLAVEWLGK